MCLLIGERVATENLANRVNLRLGGAISNKEINSALDFLEQTLLMYKLKPLQVLRKRDNGYPTLCLCDHFIRYAVTGEHIPLVPQELRTRHEAIATQAGHIMESIFGTFFACLPCDSVTTFPSSKSNEEVDIVITIKLKKIPIEIKYRNTFSGKDLKGIESFCNKSQHEAPFGIIVTQEKAGKVADNIVAIPAKTMLSLV